MEPVEVTARFDESGNVTPANFQWQGSRYTIESVGRHWRDEAGLHILVMVLGNRVYELIFEPTSTTWNLKQVGEPRTLV